MGDGDSDQWTSETYLGMHAPQGILRGAYIYIDARVIPYSAFSTLFMMLLCLSGAMSITREVVVRIDTVQSGDGDRERQRKIRVCGSASPGSGVQRWKAIPKK